MVKRRLKVTEDHHGVQVVAQQTTIAVTDQPRASTFPELIMEVEITTCKRSGFQGENPRINIHVTFWFFQ